MIHPIILHIKYKSLHLQSTYQLAQLLKKETKLNLLISAIVSYRVYSLSSLISEVSCSCMTLNSCSKFSLFCLYITLSCSRVCTENTKYKNLDIPVIVFPKRNIFPAKQKSFFRISHKCYCCYYYYYHHHTTIVCMCMSVHTCMRVCVCKRF
jgi:hypothetical protein